jgi:TPR repeat protein
MSGVGGSSSPTAWDLLFLRVLYDERLPLGSPRVFALPIACGLLHERLVAERNASVVDLRSRGPHPYCASLAARPIATNVDSERVAIAWAYLNGLGVARDLDAAEHWAQRSKALGDRDADYLLYSIGRARMQR